jgi:hypothetical protein
MAAVEKYLFSDDNLKATELCPVQYEPSNRPWAESHAYQSFHSSVGGLNFDDQIIMQTFMKDSCVQMSGLANVDCEIDLILNAITKHCQY